MGQRFPNDYTENELHKNVESLEKAVTIPVDIRIEAEHRVYDQSEVEEILRNAKKIALQNCGCRVKYGNCDLPLKTCLNLDEAADEIYDSKKYDSTPVTVEEALETLKMSHDAGLVHMAYTMNGETKPTLICSCCSCCCHTLGGLLRFGIATHVLTSKYIAQDDSSKCTTCGNCVERCTFMAREIKDGQLQYDTSKCFGCGLCVSTCPTETIQLTLRNN